MTMDRFKWPWSLKKRPSAKDVINSHTKSTPEEVSKAASYSLPDGYELINLNQPDGTVIAVRRKLALWEDRPDSPNPPCRPASLTGSARTVVSRARDGSMVRVQRPARDSFPSSRSVSRLSCNSSVYSRDSARDTMASTSSIVDTARADLRSSQRRRHSRRGGSATTTASGMAASGTSGSIHIGHIEEVDEEESERSSSEYDETDNENPEEEEAADDFTTRDYQDSRGSCDSGASGLSILPRHAGVGGQNRPAAPSYKTYASRHESWGYFAKIRANERLASQSVRAPASRRTIWARRLVHGSSYFMASCSIVLPAMFLVVGILIGVMHRKLISSWPVMHTTVHVAATIWPVVFAAVVAQCFKSGILYQDSRNNRAQGQVGESKKQLSLAARLEVICLLVFTVWSLAPLGSQALLHVYGSVVQAKQDATNVWYVDRTGYNMVWSVNSTSTTAANRSELVQRVSEKYINSLAPRTGTSDEHEPTSYTLPVAMLSRPAGSFAGPRRIATTGDDIGNSTTGGISTPTHTLSFTMTASHFNLTCGSWTTMLKNSTKTTSDDQISYSTGQTLGLSMKAGDNSSPTPMGSVTFASMNKISVGNGTDSLEYSVIQCEYKQYLYYVPIQCDQGNSISTGSCVQSAKEGLMLDSGMLPDTELGDFAQDFVSANLPTTEASPTITEAYIQNGDPVDPTSLAVQRDDNALFNLSATVAPEDFARRFGHLFNTWVSLGYCPQCIPDVLAGNNTTIPADLQPSYRSVTATTASPGEELYIIRWAWLIVFLVLSTLLLVAGITSVFVESIAVTSTGPSERPMPMWAAARAEDEGDLLELQLPKACSAGHNNKRSSQWAKHVMYDMEAAAAAGYPGGLVYK
jgi:hypothetical protein